MIKISHIITIIIGISLSIDIIIISLHLEHLIYLALLFDILLKSHGDFT